MPFRHIQQFFFFGLLIASTSIFLWMLGSYLVPVFWALVIAIVFYPLHERIFKWTKERSSFSALLTIFALVLIVIIPLTVIGGMVVQESYNLYQKVSQPSAAGDDLSFLERANKLTNRLEPYGISQAATETKLRELSIRISQTLSASLLSFSQLTFSLFINIAITLYLIFFFFRDGRQLKQILMHYLPLNDINEKRLFVRFTETTRAVVEGTLAIALLQGLLGGLTFWATGVPNPALWGVAMALLAIFPAIGPALIWVPAGIILIISGSLIGGITILIMGALLVSVVDDLLRPTMVGKGAKMPDAIILLSTLGGLASFGISGFVVGPIIAAFFLSLWAMFEERYRTELNNNN